MEKYNYLVKPRIPIRNVIPGQIITREKIVSLELEQVKSCLRHGPVFRKFNSGESVQVTLNNCERLHAREYTSEIEVKPTFIKSVEENRTSDKEESIVEEVVEKPVEESVKEEITEEQSTEENKENSEEVVEKQVEESVEEEITEEQSVDEENKEAQKKQYNNNYNKNKKKKINL